MDASDQTLQQFLLDNLDGASLSLSVTEEIMSQIPAGNGRTCEDVTDFANSEIFTLGLSTPVLPDIVFQLVRLYYEQAGYAIADERIQNDVIAVAGFSLKRDEESLPVVIMMSDDSIVVNASTPK